MGATGAGKSTLLCYLDSGDDNFIVKNDDGEIITKNKSVAEIGGSQATTLIPNILRTNFGVLLDCPGDGDTGGAIIEIINSTIKA